MNVELEQRLYELGVNLDDLAADDILTTAQAARLAGVKPQAITNWRERGYIGPDKKRVHLRNIGDSDRPRYLRIDIALAEHATRRPGMLRNATDIAAYQINEHWHRINPDTAAA